MSEATYFISYRRDDTAGYARSVCDALAREFGADHVFMDVDDIAVGQPFSEVIQQAMGGSQALLVLIGPRWRGERDDRPPRIMEHGDFVHLEVATALKKGMRVIPLLFDGATMPTASQLPHDLRALSERNALDVDATRFADDMARLIEALKASPKRPVGTTPDLSIGHGRPWLAFGGGAAVLALLGGLWWLRASTRDATGTSAISATQSAATTRPALNGEWQGTVRYPWSNDDYVEQFLLEGDGADVQGTASLLRVPRVLLDGRVTPDGVSFVTRTRDIGGAEQVHRYRARLVGGELQVRMQTEADGAAQPAIEFVAKRVAPVGR